MPGKPPYFPFYVKDFVADSMVQAMTTEQVGAYTLLLCFAWQSEPPGSLPPDETVLARIARLTPSRWAEIAPGVLACWERRSDGRYHQKRMCAEFEKLQNLINKRSMGGQKGMQSRYRDKDPPSNSVTNPVTNTDLTTRVGSGSGSFPGEEKEGCGGNGKGPAPPNFDFTAPGCSTAFIFYYHAILQS